MRMALTVAAAFFLIVEGFAQQQTRPRPALLLHGNFVVSPDTTGEIHGVVVAQDGRPAKGALISVLRLCPEDEVCFIEMSSTTTNEAGEFLFDVTFGNYSVSVGLPVDFVPPTLT